MVTASVGAGANGGTASRSCVRRTRPAVDDVLAMSTKVCAPRVPPDSPSASTQRVAVAVVPGELCASVQYVGVTAGPGNHIERSTTIGTALVEVIAHDTVALTRAWPRPGK